MSKKTGAYLTPELAQEIREALSLVKAAEDSVVRLANLEEEVTLLKQVLKLIKQGGIAPYKIEEVVAEVLEDPSQLKKYSEYHPNIGSIVNRKAPASRTLGTGVTDEDFYMDLKNILGDL